MSLRHLTQLTAAMLFAGTTIGVATSHATEGLDAAGRCVGDQNDDGTVTINELIVGVNNALDGCAYQPVTINFRAAVGSESFACGSTYNGIGTTGATIEPSDFRFYVSDVRLVTADGTEVAVQLDQDGIWQLDDVALLDFENKDAPCTNGTTQTNGTVRGRVPMGEYTGLRFALGVPPDKNHQDASVAQSPLNLTGMFWSWQDGYKFVRIDTANDQLRIHVGSTGCVYGEPGQVSGCARPNRAEIRLAPFDASSNTVVADLAALLADSDITANQPATPPGCMASPDDQDCAPMLRNLGLHFPEGLPNFVTQKFFRVE